MGSFITFQFEEKAEKVKEKKERLNSLAYGR